MPPEPLPWDRKERNKHERSSDSSSLSRWRPPYRGAPSDFRRPPGYGKQGGWHPYFEESGQLFNSSRYNEKNLDDDRPSGFFVDGKYARNGSRESRGNFAHKGWKDQYWENAASPNGLGRPINVKDDQRLVDDMLPYNFNPTHSSDFVNSCDQHNFKEQQDKNGDGNGSGTGQRFERENSLGCDWKVLKWSRSGSLSSRASGFSNSSSSKSMGVDSMETKSEVQPGNVTPVQSPSGDAAACVTSAALPEETSCRKKPRLGWGEGLAKYEKKKVEGPDDIATKNGMVTAGASNTVPMHSLVSNLAVKSPRVSGFSDCASPATPSSVACSSSSGLEDTKLVKGANVYNDSSVLSGSPGLLSQDQFDGLAFSIGNLNLTSVATLNSNLSSSISELLQSDDSSLVDCGYARSSATNKLLVWKGEILKAVEITESEIDLLENELKGFVSEPGSACPCPAASSSLPMECHANPCEELGAATNIMPTPLPIESTADVIMGRPPNTPKEEHIAVKDEDIDSPGTATSNFVEPFSLEKAVSLSGRARHGECSEDLDMNRSGNLAVKCPVYGVNEEKTGFVSACGDGAQLIASNNCATPSTDSSLHCHRDDILYDLIFASNKDSVNTASEVLYKLLPTKQCYVDISRAANVSCVQNDDLIKEKFAARKRFLRFKERVLTLKFRAFQHLWKEDMRLLSMRKYSAKSQKKFDLSLRSVHTSYPKNRSSIRSRFSSPAGNLSLVPTTEIINFTSRLLSDSQVKIYRNKLKVPALILDKKEKMVSRFISSNGLVEDPFAVEKERSMSSPWTSDAKEIFIDKLATFGKDFKKIASFFDNKTTADCIEFYYKNHKSDCFQKAKKKPEFAKHGKSYSTNTYLVTSGKRWNRESNAASLDLLGAASAIAANVDDGMAIQQKCTSEYFFGAYSDYKASRGEGGILEKSSSLHIFGNERETVAADVLAGICGSLSSEAVSSCITSSVDPGGGECYQEWKYQKLTRRSPTPDVAQNFDDETCSDESCGEMDSADWTDEEKSIFIQAVASYGKDFSMISRCVRTKSKDQCKVFFSKARKCLGLDIVCPGPGNQGTPISDEANGGGSDGEDACVVETGSVKCSDKSGSKMEEDLSIPDLKINHGLSDPAGTMNLQPDLNQSEENNRPGKLECNDARFMSENLVPDGHQIDHKPELDLDGDCNIEVGVSCESMDLQGQGSAIMPSNSESQRDEATRQVTFEKSISVRATNDQGLCTRSAAEIETKAVSEVSAEPSTAGLLVLPKDRLNDKPVENSCATTSAVNGSDCAIQDMNSVPHSARDGSDLGVDMHSSSGFVVLSGYQHKADLEFDSTQKTIVVSLQQPQDFSAVKNGETRNNNDTSSTLDLKKIKDPPCQKSVIMDDYHQHLSRPSMLDHPVESSQILKGYPLLVSPKMQLNGGISCKKPTPLPGISKLDGNFHSNRYLEQDSYLQPCNSLKHRGSVGELPFLSHEPTRDLPRPPSRSSSDVEKPCRNGDVKLFGQILTPPSSQQKPNGQTLTHSSSHQKPKSSTHDSEDKSAEVTKSSGNSFNLKFTGNHGADGNSTLTKFDHNNYLAIENIPMRSYGFWDGKRIQTGFPSLPDSAIILAKYPAAFGNYPTPSCKIEQQPLLNVVKSSESSLNGGSVFQTREISSSNGGADYQRQDLLYTEMQRHYGFEAVSSIQQQARMVGINVSGGGGILVGGSCSGVSDPVAAIKMHYAKAEQYSSQAGSIIRDEDSWRGKGDIGR